MTETPLLIYDHEAEQSVAAAVIAYPELLYDNPDVARLEEKNFLLVAAGATLPAVRAIMAAGGEVSHETVGLWLREHNYDEGIAFQVSTWLAPPSRTVGAFAQRVLRDSIRRHEQNKAGELYALMDRDQTISVEDMHTQMKAVTAELLAPFEAVGGQAAVAAPWSGQGEITIAHSLCLADLQEWKPKPIAWTRLGWFAEFGSNIIAAASGAGKSFKLEDEAIHLAGQGYRVLILSGDKGFASVAERLKCMLDGRGAATLPGDLQLVDVQGLDLASAEGCDALSGLLDERGADALILDMLGTYAHLREWGSTAEPALLMSRLRMLAERLRGGLYLGVRCRKPKDFTKDKLIDSVKDSVEIVGGADSIAVITTTGDEDAKVRTLRHAKCSFHREAAPLNFKILGDVPGPVRVIYEEAREASSQRLEEAKAAAIRVVKESKIPLYKTALADKLGIDHNLGVQAVEALLQEGRLGYVSPGKRSPVVLREREYVQEERNDLF